ncbi:MAG: hypothetical protein SOX69_07600, partial [Oscillospiraceae bacterium]|nr:hypothetical protein [Oscillospiraceae bacterium]
LCFILQTNFAARRTFVRLRANKIKSEALILLSLSVPHLFFLSPKKGAVKKPGFFTALFYEFLKILLRRLKRVFFSDIMETQVKNNSEIRIKKRRCFYD